MHLVRFSKPLGGQSDGEPATSCVLRGIVCMVLATAMFATSNAISKLMTASYPVGEIMFLRSASSLLCCSIAVLPFAGLAVFSTRIPKAHLARGLSQSISQTFTVVALSMMPLAGVTAIGFTAPLFAALIAIIALKEKADRGRMGMLAAGFIGTIVIIHPGSDSLQLGAAFAFANAVMYGSVTVAVRQMSRSESAPSLLMWQMATVAGFHSLLLVFGFARPALSDTTLLFASGAANALGQLFWTKALSLAPATAVSPFYYTLIVWSGMIGYFVWGELPTLSLIIGSTIIASSGIALAWWESRARATPGKVPAKATPTSRC